LWIGPSARPANAIELLKQRGFEAAEHPEDFLAARELQWEG
jgi:hypothetical protein